MMDTITRLQRATFDGRGVNRNPHQFKKMPPNCISCYRLEEGLSLQTLRGILGVASPRRAKELCEAPHPSVKYIHILASREGLSVSEFQRRYTPIKTDAA